MILKSQLINKSNWLKSDLDSRDTQDRGMRPEITDWHPRNINWVLRASYPRPYVIWLLSRKKAVYPQLNYVEQGK